jgi:hypothetical protein
MARESLARLPQPLQPPDAPERVECVCSRKPLLARGGLWRGGAFLWIKNVRAKLDMVVVSGTVRIKCRECNRWHTITIRETVSTEAIDS